MDALGPIILIFQTAVHAVAVGSSKVLVQQASPLFALGIRSFFSGLILLGIMTIRNNENYRRFFNRIPAFLFGAFIRMLIPSTCLFWVLKHVPVAKLAIFANFKPFVTFLLSYMLLSENMTKNRWLGISIGMSGMLPIVVSQQTKSEELLNVISVISLPELVTVFAIIVQCYGWIHFRQYMKANKDLSVISVVGIESLLAGIIGLVGYIMYAGIPEIANPPRFFGFLTVAVLLGNVLRRTLVGWLLKHYTATILALANLAFPFFSAFVGWVLFKETIGWEFFLSTALVLSGFIIFLREEQPA